MKKALFFYVPERTIGGPIGKISMKNSYSLNLLRRRKTDGWVVKKESGLVYVRSVISQALLFLFRAILMISQTKYTERAQRPRVWVWI